MLTHKLVPYIEIIACTKRANMHHMILHGLTTFKVQREANNIYRKVDIG